MKFSNPTAQKFWRFSTSFQLGIPVLVAITLLITWGTIVESQYDAYAAQRTVYHSWMMSLTMGLLIYNLAAVMIDRLPWKKRHIPFLCVHIGIISMILGGWVTQKYGLDGSMYLPIGGKNNFVTVSQTDLVVYATFDGDSYTKFYEREVDFFKTPPTEEKPVIVYLGAEQIKITKYLKYARVSKKITATTDERAGDMVKIQLQNPNVKQVETLIQPSKTKSAEVNLGPLKIYFAHVVKDKGRKDYAKNEIYLNTGGGTADNKNVKYSFYKINESLPFKTGQLQIGDVIDTGWMGLELRLLDFQQQVKEITEAVESPRPTPLTTPAIYLEFKGEKQWALINDVTKFFTEKVAYIMSYQNRRIDLGFPVNLKEFQMTQYEGTNKAKTYASRVSVENQDLHLTTEALIEMNEPMKFAGYTFYQSSFNQDEKTGEPIASVLSVNKDPGRWIKYLGSLILSLGIIWFFVQNRKRKTAQ